MTMKQTLSNDLLKLPVVLTSSAWLEAVHDDSAAGQGVQIEKLADLIFLAYRELGFQPQAREISFGIYRFPPTGNKTDRVWLELRLNLIESDLESPYLRISLRDESDESATKN